MKSKTKHDVIKAQLSEACQDYGFETFMEYRGKGWRADVFAIKDAKKIAFEIQVSPQSLKKTLDRQKKYIRDNILCCWLFETSPAKLSREHPDLPLFELVEQNDNSFLISLCGRKELSLYSFVCEFLNGNIKFAKIARTISTQSVKIIFYEMECWKCKAMNHIYYVDSRFRAARNMSMKMRHLLS